MRPQTSSSRGLYIAAWALPVALMAMLGFTRPAGVARLQDQLFDAYQRFHPGLYDPDAAPVRIVDIDDASLAALGQWPWPRTTIARLVERLADAGAATIAFDMVFAEPDRTSPEALLASVADDAHRRAVAAAISGLPGNDAMMAEAIGHGKVVLGLVLERIPHAVDLSMAKAGIAFTGTDPRRVVPGFPGAVVPLPVFRQGAAGIGALNWLPDGDQIVRRVPLMLHLADGGIGRLVPSLALESLRVAQGASTILVRTSVSGVDAIRVGEITAETGWSGDVRPRFTPHRSERFVSAASVLDGTFDPASVRDRIVVVGSSSAGLTDIRATPLDPAMPGVEIQAQTLESILAQSQLIRPPWLVLEIAVGALLALALATILPRLPSLGGLLSVVAALGALAGASWFAFAHQRLVDPIVPGAMVAAAYVGATAALFGHEQRDRRFVQAAFGRFVSPAVVSRLASDPSALTLGGEQRELTVMFTDVRDFSAIAESMDARRLTEFVNRYLSPMTAIVLERQGTLDKYIGDAVMAFWNAPLVDPDHAKNAARTALAMVAALPALRAVDADAATLRIGIGIATGPCVVGNFGSSLRFDYSAIGDDVNLASRLESLSKLYGIDILASEATAAAAAELAWLEVDLVIVAGRSSATRLFTLVGDEAVARGEPFVTLRSDHNAMLTAYRAGQFVEAERACADLRRRAARGVAPLYDVFAARCERLCVAPPQSWDGITRMERK